MISAPNVSTDTDMKCQGHKPAIFQNINVCIICLNVLKLLSNNILESISWSTLKYYNLLTVDVFRLSGILIWTLLWLLTNLNLSSGLNNEWLCRVDFVWVWIMAGGWLVVMWVIMAHDWYLIHSYQLWSRIFNVKQNINHVSIRRIECGDSATDTHN